MPFTKFVEIGRVCTLNYGPNSGKKVIILNIQNEKRALIEGINNDVIRQMIPIRRLSLSKFKVPILMNQRTGLIKKAIKKFDLQKKWDQSPLAQKLAAKEKRSKLNDFQRFKVMVLKKQLSKKMATQVNILKKTQKKSDGKKSGKK